MYDYSDLYLRVLAKVNRARPHHQEGEVGSYYAMLGDCLQRLESGTRPSPTLRSLLSAITAPFTWMLPPLECYRALAFSFLTRPSKRRFEEAIPQLSKNLNMAKLSEAIVTRYSGDGSASETQEQRLWLLAHFIHFLRSTNSQSQSQASFSLDLKAMYLQLSALSNTISVATSTSSQELVKSNGSKEADGLFVLPAYVETQIGSLVSQEGIYDILEKFARQHSLFDVLSEDASLIAAYTLTLIRSFPSQGDDIRMRLFLVDIQTGSDGVIPALRFFYDAMCRTRVFWDIKDDEENAFKYLRRTNEGLEREWRSILLFLELYSFVLRLTDDDDFFSAASNHLPQGNDDHGQSTSRLRRLGLSLDQLLSLTQFLKHLSFVLIYHPNKFMEREGATEFSVLPGVDYNAFRTIVTTTMRMLYERDSRRPFTPKHHWLMMERFDMEGFLAAVILEEQRQYELKEQEDREEEGASDTDEEALDDFVYRAMSRAGLQRSRNARLELLRRQQKKVNRERALAQVTPKLEILRNMPFVIPFEIRVLIFRQLVQLDQRRRRGGYLDPDSWRAWMMQQNNDFGLGPNQDMGR